MKVISKGSVLNGGSYLPNDIRVEFRIKTYRIESLDTSKSLSILYDIVRQDTSINIRWQMIKGADIYELQYIYFDEFDVVPSSVEQKFANALLVENIHNQYLFDLIYPKGTLYFRIRPVGRFIGLSGLVDRLNYGKWSSLLSVSINKRFSNTRPYQFVSSFAEEGKNKKVINYFDNTLRSRQEITYLNDEQVSLVGESDYDAENQ